MEVTKDNFEKAFSILEREIQEADFIAIDGEFTGLSTIKSHPDGYNTLSDIYIKTRIGSEKMLLIQYGVSLFTWNEQRKCYQAWPFTFYIFPRPYKKYNNDVIFTGQSSSMNFLSCNGFDFNKLFHKGISFMNLQQEEKARYRIAKDFAGFEENTPSAKCESDLKPPGDDSFVTESSVFIPEDQKEIIESIFGSIVRFMGDESQLVMDLPTCNQSQRGFIYKLVEEKYPLGLYLDCVTKENEEKFIRCHKTSQNSGSLKDKLKEEEDLLEEAVGFSKVIKLLSNSNKPIVGHNMKLDLFLTITNFLGPAPFNLLDFKEKVLNTFPIVFDTKLIASVPPVNEVAYRTGLQGLVELIDNETLPIPDVIIAEDLQNETNATDQYHQAGYDAYCTGRLFLSLSEHIFTCAGKGSEHIDLSSELLEHYKNRIYIMGLRDVFFTNLANEDVMPDRSNVFYIRFPPGWRRSHIEDVFSPYSSINYPINWIDRESAFVTLCEKEKLDFVIENLITNSSEENEYLVLPYQDYMRRLDAQDYTRVQKDNSEMKRKRKRTESEMEEGKISV